MNPQINIPSCHCCGSPAMLVPNYELLITCSNPKCPHYGYYDMADIWNTRPADGTNFLQTKIANQTSEIARLHKKVAAQKEHIHRLLTKSAEDSSLFCEHANEMPTQCPCKKECYCKGHSCKLEAI